MAKNTKQANVIVIDEVEYDIDDMTEGQKALVNHIADLTRKINGTQFQLEQLQVGAQAFTNALKESLEAEDAEIVEE